MGARAPRPLAFVALAAALCLLSACATQGRPLITDRSLDSTANASTYLVHRGDTLYSIAWRFGVKAEYLAALNGLPAPYTIYPGQRLKVKGQASVPAKTTASPPVAKPTRKAPTAVARPAPSRLSFRWPVQAKPSREFGRGNKGLDFALPVGAQVRFAAAGEVVYAGSGLGGYKVLVIVRHGGGYLSAYSLNRDVNVTEGARVKAGQKLADIRRTGRAALLHFEIRKDGEPISPRSVMN